MIIPVYKPIGASTHRLAKQVGKLHQTKATHTGTLDPMADGVVIALTGQDRFKKDELSSWKKHYKFEILWGVNTDSHDLLGLTNQISEKQINSEKLTKVLPKFTGKINQQLPKFSARRIDGQSYFDKAKQGKDFIPQTETVHIHNLELIQTYIIPKEKLWSDIQHKLSLIKGDFRQKKILNKWQEVLPNLPNQLTITKFKTTTSKRTYIRSLVRDLSQELQIPATTFSLTRTQNGNFTIKDCICLI